MPEGAWLGVPEAGASADSSRAERRETGAVPGGGGVLGGGASIGAIGRLVELGVVWRACTTGAGDSISAGESICTGAIGAGESICTGAIGAGESICTGVIRTAGSSSRSGS